MAAYRSVDISKGWDWLSRAGSLVMANPGAFAVIGLIVAVILMVPILGGLAFAIFGPTFYAGIMYAAREQDQGRKAEITHLFQGFQAEGKLPKLLVLCLPGIAAAVVLTVFAVILLGGALLGAIAGSAAESQGLALGALGVGGVIFFLLAIVIGFFTYALTFFATPRVMFDDLEPFAAMKESFSAVIANIAAVIVFVVLVVVAAVVASVILGLVSAMLGSFLVTLAAVPLVSTAIYFAWVDVFGGQAAAAAATPPPPVEPPPPAPQA